MSQFYTNIQLAGDTILYRGYQDGTPVQFRTKFSPTLYLPSKKDEMYKTLDGRSVAPMEFLTARDAREFIKKYDGIMRKKIKDVGDKAKASGVFDLDSLSDIVNPN